MRPKEAMKVKSSSFSFKVDVQLVNRIPTVY